MKHRAPTLRSAFTLVEMLVVVTVIVVAMVALLPAFSRLIDSNNYASAVNAVSATLARSASRGVEGGVVFLWDPRLEQMTLVQVELHNADASLRAGEDGRVPAVAFRPVPGSQPVQLPAGYGVYGLSMMHDDLAPAANPAVDPPTMDDTWYPEEAVWQDNPNIVTSPAVRRMVLNPWLFPRNDIALYTLDFDPANVNDPNHPANIGELAPDNIQIPTSGLETVYDPNQDSPWRHLQTFFIWFGADGSLRTAASMPQGVNDCYLEHPDLPFDPELEPSDPDYLLDLDDRFDPQAYYDGLGAGWPVFNPEVHMRPAEMLAIVDFSRMREGTGVVRPWYLRVDSDQAPPFPADKTAESYPLNQLNANETIDVRRVYDWIDRNAEIIGFNRYTGQALKR